MKSFAASHAHNSQLAIRLARLLILTASFMLATSIHAENTANDRGFQLMTTAAEQVERILTGDEAALVEFAATKDELEDYVIESGASVDKRVYRATKAAITIGSYAADAVKASSARITAVNALKDFHSDAKITQGILTTVGTPDQTLALNRAIAAAEGAGETIQTLEEADVVSLSLITDIQECRDWLNALLNGSPEVKPLNHPDALQSLGRVFGAFVPLEDAVQEVADLSNAYVKVALAGEAIRAELEP